MIQLAIENVTRIRVRPAGTSRAAVDCRGPSGPGRTMPRRTASCGLPTTPSGPKPICRHEPLADPGGETPHRTAAPWRQGYSTAGHAPGHHTVARLVIHPRMATPSHEIIELAKLFDACVGRKIARRHGHYKQNRKKIVRANGREGGPSVGRRSAPAGRVLEWRAATAPGRARRGTSAGIAWCPGDRPGGRRPGGRGVSLRRSTGSDGVSRRRPALPHGGMGRRAGARPVRPGVSSRGRGRLSWRVSAAHGPPGTVAARHRAEGPPGGHISRNSRPTSGVQP
jgi:hypothetical protein